MSSPDEILEKYPSLKKFTGSDDDVESHDGREITLLKYIYAHPSLNELRGNPTAILRVIDEFAAQDEFLINIGSDKGEKVRELIAKEKPAVFVELGAYVGYSAIWFGDAMRQAAGPDKKIQFWSLEFDPLIASIAMNLVDLAGLSDIVKIVVGTAADSLARLSTEGKLTKIDFLFLDHVEDLYLADLKNVEALQLLHPGALVVADNVLRPGAPEYRTYVREHAGMESWAIPGLIIPGELEDELEVTRIK
ncbi:S-adenosyl-L-methionine-dependent methyltransferase [Penicillium hispanicum]|uniref:S-adenosyl-L-methionine-dependent methyltransferase n=1 Tax=Penicillium hispanicum TaxID=1080232 RepID=UPI00253F9BD3|nr:S-adenosyl-L-methionine-dependent methyltransferase [Penicillium hispanicum]KAJ5585117.1 S-adenosyl-L-methionine-dependent methyltransferase [Penicillium hispanicum]